MGCSTRLFSATSKKTQREVTPSEFSTLSIITIKGKIRNGVSVLLVGSVTIPEDEALLIYGEKNW